MWPVEAQHFTYPSYEGPLLSAYEGRFECAYAVLHPFVLLPERDANSDCPDDDEFLAGCSRYRWDQVASETNLKTYSEINHGLLSGIRALRTEFENAAARDAIESFLLRRKGQIWPPSEGGFPMLLRGDITRIFEMANVDELLFVPEFPEMDPVSNLKAVDICTTGGRVRHDRGTLLAPDRSFLFTVDWDSFFTLFYGPFGLVSRAVEENRIEGFFLGSTTSHGWWRESIPISKT